MEMGLCILNDDLFGLQFSHGEIEGLAKGRGCEAFSHVTKRMHPNDDEIKQAEFILFSWEEYKVHPDEVKEMYQIIVQAQKLLDRVNNNHG